MKKASYFEFIKHAISTPLSTILIDSQLALEKNNDQKFKEILLSATQIKNLLEKDQFKEKRRLFSLNSALTEIIFLNQCLHKEVSYAKKLQQTASLQINGNRLLFQEIVACLLNNAVEAYQNKDLNKVILIKSQIKNNLLEIAIADGGCGLNSWQKFLAGNKFYSLKESHSGIGLFYVKRILKKYR